MNREPTKQELDCAKKKRWGTASLAVKAAHLLRMATGSDTINAYHCPICRRWHIGNTKRR